MESFFFKRLREAPYSEFKRVSTSLNNFSSVGSSPIFMLNNTDDGHRTERKRFNQLYESHVPSFQFEERCEKWHIPHDDEEGYSVPCSEVYLHGRKAFLCCTSAELGLHKAFSR